MSDLVRPLMIAAVMAFLLAAPSAAAFQVTGPAPPDTPEPPCPATDPGEGGILGELLDLAHDATGSTCTIVDMAHDLVVWTVGDVYAYVRDSVGFILRVLGPVLDGTQENVCNVVYGPPPHDDDLGCCEIHVDLRDPLAERPCFA